MSYGLFLLFGKQRIWRRMCFTGVVFRRRPIKQFTMLCRSVKRWNPPIAEVYSDVLNVIYWNSVPLNLYIREMYNCYCRSYFLGAVVTLGNSIFFCKLFSKFHEKRNLFISSSMIWCIINHLVQESDCKKSFSFRFLGWNELKEDFFFHITSDTWNHSVNLFWMSLQTKEEKQRVGHVDPDSIL